MKFYRAAIYLLTAATIAAVALRRTLPVQGRAEAAAASASTGWGPSALWSEANAAKYLDEREVWWQSWPKARKDHGTICISCHTTVRYAMARPTLHGPLHETAASVPEKVLLESVEKRVGDWDEMVPFYSDDNDGPGKTAESRSTEAVMNAVILAAFDRHDGNLSPIARKALDEAWALQIQTGDDAGG